MGDARKIGILGGGQLGLMLLQSIMNYGLEVAVMDEDEHATCSKYTSKFFKGDPNNYDEVIAFGSELDCITIEKEAVNVKALAELKRRGVTVIPDPAAIAIVQDRQLQKKFLENMGAPVAHSVAIANKQELAERVSAFPMVLKKCSQGYDGRGIMVLRGKEDLEKAFDEPCILEAYIERKQELSVMVARDAWGYMECYSPVSLIMDNDRNVLDCLISPAKLTDNMRLQVCDIATKIAEALHLIGIMAVELFVDQHDRVIVNELSVRPHNSGHHTIEACVTSQFHQLARILLGLPPGSARNEKAALMMNILAPALNPTFDYLQEIGTMNMDGVHVHLYGKAPSKPGRKIGHVTITGKTTEAVIARAANLRHILKEKPQL
jgi:5-(carboxyamino)imidazole ribonucleotide synthase